LKRFESAVRVGDALLYQIGNQCGCSKLNRSGN
jgi:hypothetical protein